MKKNKQKKVIGAGIAGLAACTKLTEFGFDVEILEARNYVGGRICFDHSLGFPLGKGAAWIHGDKNNPITELAKSFNVKMRSVDSNKFVIFDKNGLPISSTEIKKFNKKFLAYLNKAKKLAYFYEFDISLFTLLKSIIKLEKISSLEKILFENKLKEIESYVGCDVSHLSARSHDDAKKIWPGKNCFLTSSYQPIIEGLALKCQIKLNTIVKEINFGKNIEIITNNLTYFADYVVITLPLGVLQNNAVKFNPPLPNNKIKSIHSLGMGLFNIMAIKFPKIFWSKKPHALFFTQFDKVSTHVFFNLARFTSQPVLLGYTGGQTALQLENFSDEELIKKMTINFKKHFTDVIPDPSTVVITRWAQDKFSYGSYSYFKTGSKCADYDAIAQPIGNKLFFAGEATFSKYPATTHGAYLSGIREAERIQKIQLNK